MPRGDRQPKTCCKTAFCFGEIHPRRPCTQLGVIDFNKDFSFTLLMRGERIKNIIRTCNELDGTAKLMGQTRTHTHLMTKDTIDDVEVDAFKHELWCFSKMIHPIKSRVADGDFTLT